MRNIRDVLRIRGFWVRDFDDATISEELINHLRNGTFRYVRSYTQHQRNQNNQDSWIDMSCTLRLNLPCWFSFKCAARQRLYSSTGTFRASHWCLTHYRRSTVRWAAAAYSSRIPKSWSGPPLVCTWLFFITNLDVGGTCSIFLQNGNRKTLPFCRWRCFGQTTLWSLL